MVFRESPSPGAWQDSPCETKGVTPKDDGSAAVHCECTEPGYVAVFLVKDDSGQLILMPQKPLFSRRLEYKLVRKKQAGTPATSFQQKLQRVRITLSYRFGDSFTGSCYWGILLAWAALQMVFCIADGVLPTSTGELARKQSPTHMTK